MSFITSIAKTVSSHGGVATLVVANVLAHCLVELTYWGRLKMINVPANVRDIEFTRTPFPTRIVADMARSYLWKKIAIVSCEITMAVSFLLQTWLLYKDIACVYDDHQKQKKLMRAMLRADVPNLRQMLSHNPALANTKLGYPNQSFHPLSLAAFIHPDIVCILLEYGADPYSFRIIHFSRNGGFAVNPAYEDCTLVHWTTRFMLMLNDANVHHNTNAAIFRCLSTLDEKNPGFIRRNVNVLGRNGGVKISPFYLVMRHVMTNGTANPNIMELGRRFLEAGADPFLLPEPLPKTLHLMFPSIVMDNYRYAETLEVFLNYGLNPNQEGRVTGNTLLSFWMFLLEDRGGQDSEIVLQRLAKFGVHMDYIGSWQVSALHLAVLLGLSEAVGSLIRLGCDPNIIATHVAGFREVTPLHLAVALNKEEIVHYLLTKTGAQTRARDAWNRTPLDIAYSMESLGCTYLLIREDPECIVERFYCMQT